MGGDKITAQVVVEFSLPLSSLPTPTWATLASVLLLEYKLVPASGPLPCLFPLPVTPPLPHPATPYICLSRLLYVIYVIQILA